MAREASHAPAYSPDLRERVLAACERGDLPQDEIARRFQVCPATISNWRRQAREAYRQQMSALPVERLVFLDESGVTTKMARTRARAPRGQRAYGSIPLGSWQRLTVLGALACDGLVATMSIKASTSTSVLLAYRAGSGNLNGEISGVSA